MSHGGATVVGGASPGSVPVSHGHKLVTVDRRVRVAELVLRILICVLGVLAAALVGSDSQVRVFFSIEKKAKFTDMKSMVQLLCDFRFLVAANGIAATYSLIQVLRCVVSMIRGTVLFSKSQAWIIFSGDQAVAYLSLSALAAASQSSIYGKQGQEEFQWIKLCNMYGKFCNQAGEGVASAVVVTLSMAIVSSISAYSLFRLYGRNKRQGSGRR
ncbi:CASP-like protein [Drosera capensis]